jgi:hypothetical protein
MKRLLLILLAALVVAFPAAAGVEVRLVFDEATVLPGTPTGITVVVTNDSKNTVQLPAGLWLIGTNADFETFTVSIYNASDGAAAPVPEAERAVLAGATREFRFDPSSVLVGSPWFTDGRLSRPGTYRLRAVFAPAVALDGTYNAAHAIASKEEQLQVATATEEDAVVWQWMAERGRGMWGQNAWMYHCEDFEKFVMANHPESGYALYAAVFVRPRTEMMRILLEQTQRFPGKSFSEQARFLMANYHWEEMDILSRSNAQAAAEEADAARNLASEIATNSRSANMRKYAKDLLARTPTREQLLGASKRQR